MSSQEEQRNEELAHRWHMDIFQKGDLSVADEILSPDFVWRNPSIPSNLRNGSDGTKKLASSIIDGIPPGDKPVTITGFDLFRISGGKIAEMWQQFGVGKWP